MKFIYLITILPFLCFSCKKDSTALQNEQLEGVWEMRGAYGNFSITFEPGNGNRLEFSGSNYSKFEHSILDKSGKYQIVDDKGVEESVGLVIPEGSYPSRIRFDNKDEPKVYFEISNDTLYTLQGFFPSDGGSQQVYVKISN